MLQLQAARAVVRPSSGSIARSKPVPLPHAARRQQAKARSWAALATGVAALPSETLGKPTPSSTLPSLLASKHALLPDAPDASPTTTTTKNEGVARGEGFDKVKAAFFRAIERRARDPELADRVIALESPPDFPAFDFVLVYKGLAFGFSVKSDPQRWLCPTSRKKDGRQQPRLGTGESQEFDELQKLLESKNLNFDLVEDFRQLDKLRLCVKAYTKNQDFLKEEQQHAGFSLSGVGAVFGFDVDDDVRDRFKQIMSDVDLPDNYVGQEALRDSVPGGLLVFSALSRSVWGS
jgi:hypothetical protein